LRPNNYPLAIADYPLKSFPLNPVRQKVQKMILKQTDEGIRQCKGCLKIHSLNTTLAFLLPFAALRDWRFAQSSLLLVVRNA